MEPIPVSMIVIKNRIKDYRHDFEITQEELADAVGVSRQSIISVETGRCLPSVPLALAISRFFNFPIEQLFYVENNKGEEVIMPREDRSPGSIRGGLLHDAIGRMFEDSVSSWGRNFSGHMVPSMNIYQTEKEIVVEADVPGMKEDDIDIEVSEGVLTIKGERKEENEDKNKEYFHREVSYGSFQRAVTLPTDIQADKAEATVKHGQLKVVLPKIAPEQVKVHKVKAKKAE